MQQGNRDPKSHAVLDNPEIASVLFHPRKAADRQATLTPDLLVPVTDRISLGASVFPASAEAPVVVLFHGNGELASEYEAIAPLYGDAGISLVVLDYRGYGFSGGSPGATTMLSDARTAFHLLPDLLADLGLGGRLFVMGRSLGSAPALEIASTVRHRLEGLIIESGFAYTFPLVQRLGGPALAADEKRDGFDQLEKMERVSVPTLVIHGEEDRIIPVTDGRALHRHCRAREKRLLTVPGAGHNDLLVYGRDAYLQAVAALTGA